MGIFACKKSGYSTLQIFWRQCIYKNIVFVRIDVWSELWAYELLMSKVFFHSFPSFSFILFGFIFIWFWFPEGGVQTCVFIQNSLVKNGTHRPSIDNNRSGNNWRRRIPIIKDWFLVYLWNHWDFDLLVWRVWVCLVIFPPFFVICEWGATR